VRAANEFQNVRCRFKQTADQRRDKVGGVKWALLTSKRLSSLSPRTRPTNGLSLPARHRYNLVSMGRAEKLAGKILSGKSDKNFAFNGLCYVLERAGFQRRSGKGSHRIYYKEGVIEIVNVQPRNGKAKPYQVKQVRELLLKYKIDIE
jgi:hypothetical protein